MKVFLTQRFTEDRHVSLFRPEEDVDGAIVCVTAGFTERGQIDGFVWYQNSEYDHPYFGVEDTFFQCGIRGPHGTLRCGVAYHKDTPERRTVFGSPSDFPALRIELADGLPVFCGMQEGGLRHGLGSEWRHGADGTVTELQGLWQGGVLTHLREGGVLVPVPNA